MTGALLIVLIILGLTGAGLRHLYRHPYKPHRRCGGTGRNSGSTHDAYGHCKCREDGARVRIPSALLYRALGRRDRL